MTVGTSRAAIWRAANPERAREWARYWRAANLQKCRESQRRSTERAKKPCVGCGKPCLGASKNRSIEPRCLACAGAYYRGRRNGNYKHGLTAGGYRRVMGMGRLVLKHRVVWEKANGPIPKGWIVHHLNGDRLDNRLENLQAMSIKKHLALHKKRAGKVPTNTGGSNGDSCANS